MACWMHLDWRRCYGDDANVRVTNKTTILIPSIQAYATWCANLFRLQLGRVAWVPSLHPCEVTHCGRKNEDVQLSRDGGSVFMAMDGQMVA